MSALISSLREAVLQKIPEFYEFFFTNGGRGLVGFHISYSEIVILPKFVENLNKNFIKAVRGGGHRFMKAFHKIPVFFEGWLP